MDKLIEYILQHTERGECQCGKCFDKGPDRRAPEHSVNVHFFWVSAKNEPKKEDFQKLIEESYPDLKRLEGGPSYIEIGAILGNQQTALRFIGLGHLLGVWKVMTPEVMGITGVMAAAGLAGQGLVMPTGWKRSE